MAKKDLKCFTRKKKDGGNYTTCLAGQTKQKKARPKFKLTSVSGMKNDAGDAKRKLKIVDKFPDPTPPKRGKIDLTTFEPKPIGKLKDTFKGYYGAEASVKRAHLLSPKSRKPNVTGLTERLKPKGKAKTTGLYTRSFGNVNKYPYKAHGILENPRTYLYDSGFAPDTFNAVDYD